MMSLDRGMTSRDLPNAGNGGRGGDGQSFLKVFCAFHCMRRDGRQFQE